ncbi:hypothetical protein FGB62_210g011 [Gracilaria domingensis]|nr:hypothetical protein FGB62_210g011 [Gracilaria domingensis]
MDEEMTAKGFRRFVRRRGLIPADEEEQRQASAQQSWSQRASSSQMFPLPTAPIPQPPYSHEMATTTPPASADQHARMQRQRTQRSNETTQPTRTPRRRRNETDDSARTYKCEFCNLAFGRKHHKERHVANIHRNVSGVAFDAVENLIRPHKMPGSTDLFICSAGETLRMFHMRASLSPETQP